MKQTPLDRAIAEAGSGVALAKIAGVTPMAVSHWKVRRVPAHQVLTIESATGISRYELRPDIYPQDLPNLDKTIMPFSHHGQADESAVQASSTAGAAQ